MMECRKVEIPDGVNMIRSAQEFVDLRTSERPEEHLRAAHDTAAEGVWEDVIANYPDMKFWVIHNKTVPLEILTRLSEDPDPGVRAAVASKNKLTRELMEKLADDPDDSVKQRIIRNKNVGVDLLERLSRDSTEGIAAKARERSDKRMD